MAVYKWNNREFMSEQEINNLPENKRPVLATPPVMFDLSKAERITVNKADLKVTEIQAQQEKLSDFI